MNNKILLIAALIIVGFLSFSIFQNKNSEVQVSNPRTPLSPTPEQQNVNLTANFGIYTNGTFRVFTPARYHNQSTDVYITAENPYLIHIKKPNLTWGNFFETLPMKLEKECIVTGTKETFCTNTTKSLKFYINGQLDPNALDKEIQQDDKLFVSYGDETPEEITKQMIEAFKDR